MTVVNLFADFHDPGGWGSHARGLGSALANLASKNAAVQRPAVKNRNTPQTGIDFHLVPSNPNGSYQWHHSAISNAGPSDISISLGSVALMPNLDSDNNIFCTVWETTHVPPHYRSILKCGKQIWVPTQWGRDLFVNAGLDADRIVVIPEGVDTTRFTPPDTKHRRDTFRFVCVGKWEERKGVTLLLDAFCDAFTSHDNVELIMHCDNPYLPGLCINRVIGTYVSNRMRNPPRIVPSQHLQKSAYISLLQQSDVFVLPTRAEAWGLPILEAMACGLPTIVTNYSGHLAFANNLNGWLIDVEQLCTVRDNLHFSSNLHWGEWAQPSHDHLVSLLRTAYRDRAACTTKSQHARSTALKFTWQNAATLAYRCLLSVTD